MRRLQVRVRFVLRVAPPVVGQRRTQRTEVVADIAARGDVSPGGILVEVVAEMQDQIGLVLGEAAVGRVVAGLELRARREAIGSAVRSAVGRRGAGAPDRRLAQRPESGRSSRGPAAGRSIQRAGCALIPPPPC